MKTIIIFLFLSIFTLSSYAAKLPCSGNKGGVVGCTPDKRFICKNGSISNSKAKCNGYENNKGNKIAAKVLISPSLNQR